MSMLLLIWRACGLRIAWHKGMRGSSVDWIGLWFSVQSENRTMSVRIPDAMVTDVREESIALVKMVMIPTKRLKKFAGKLSWTANLLTRTRWVVSRIWAAVKDSERVAVSVRRGDRAHPQARNGGSKLHLVSNKRVAAPLRWLAHFWGNVGPSLERQFGMTRPLPKEDVIVDACPWGIAGILEHSSTGTPLEFFAEKLNPDDANRFKVQIGDAAGQSYWEALSILCAIRAWGKFVKDRHVRLKFRTGNTAH